jgi:gas vesicle protein
MNTSNIGDQVSKTASRAEDVVAEKAHSLGELAEHALVALLSSMGLARKRSPMTSVLAFGAGFASGSAVTAMLSPLSGPELRDRIMKLFGKATDEAKEAMHDAGETMSETAKGAERKLAKGVRGAAQKTRNAVDGAADGVMDAAKHVEDGGGMPSLAEDPSSYGSQK